MSIETEMFTLLKTVAALGNRVYAGVAPQSVVKPYASFYKLSPGRKYTHGGFSDLSETRMQVSIFDTEYKKAKDVAGAVIVALEGWAAAQAAFIVGEQDMWEQETKLYHVSIDVLVWHNK